MDDMKRIVICKYCNKYEFYGDMRWLSGRCLCRKCYKAEWEHENKTPYTWDDLDGPRPTKKDYEKQEAQDADIRND